MTAELDSPSAGVTGHDWRSDDRLRPHRGAVRRSARRIVWCSYDWGEYCIRITGALARDAQVRLLLASQLAEPHLWRLTDSVSFKPFEKPRLRQPWRQLRTLWTLIRQIREFSPDVVHVQQGHLWFNLALPYLRRFPLVLTIHDPRHHLGDRGAQNTPQAIMDFGFRRADQVIVHGRQQQRVAIEQLGLHPDRVHVIPHVVLGDDQAGAPVEEEEGVVLFFGRIWAYKGLDYLIKAEPLVTAAVPTARFVIAGCGEDLARYRRLMHHPERFEVHNEYVSEGTRARLFRRASVVVLPYVEATQSGVIPIASTFSKAVVATTVGSLPEVIDDGETGLLVPPRDPESLARAIISLLRDPGRRRALGINGKRKIESECSPAVVATRTHHVYAHAMSARQ